MKKPTEGRKMFISVMTIFIVYAVVFILFEDYDKKAFQPFGENSDWHLLGFSLLMMMVLGILLHRYAQRMDSRISKEQEEQRIALRRQLTQNISHELKTPVASILGYVETIIDNPELSDEKKGQFISRTHEQAKRLTTLLQDLSMLNRMDFAPEMIAYEMLNISELMQDIAQETQIMLEAKGMTLRNCLPGDITIVGNAALVYSIFRNLLDNALNYAGNGKTIEVKAQDDEEQWNFAFSDDGVGVPQEHLPRLFERFYRIDKSRSRKTGGTGLGLAIVKNAIQLHGGQISAKINDAGGLTFVFSLKKHIK